MDIYLTCICEKRLKIPVRLGGKKVRCKYCQRVLLVPEKEAAILAGKTAASKAEDAAKLARKKAAESGEDSGAQAESPSQAATQTKDETSDEQTQQSQEQTEHESESGGGAIIEGPFVPEPAERRMGRHARKSAEKDEVFEGVDDPDEEEKANAEFDEEGKPKFLYTTCTNCRKRVKGPVEKAGKRGTCPQCGDEVYLPWVPAARTQPDAEDELATGSGFQELPGDPSSQSHAGTGLANFGDEHIAGGEVHAAKVVIQGKGFEDEYTSSAPQTGGFDIYYSGPPLSKVLLALASVVLIIIAGVTWFNKLTSGPAGSVREGYYFDLVSGELFVASDKLIPPIEAPSGELRDGGNAGVRAYVFSCGTCAEDKQRFVGYFEKYTEDAKLALAAMEKGESVAADGEDPLAQGLLVASPTERIWSPLNSPAGDAILKSISSRCGGGSLTLCQPGD